MAKNEKPEKLTGDQRALLKLADDIYDSGVADGYAEGVKISMKARKKAKTNAPGLELARACGYKGAEIARAFCAALTDANFHHERKALVPEINRLFGTDITPLG